MQEVNPVTLLKAELEGRTLQSIASQVDCSPQHIHAVVKRGKPPGPAILKFLGLRKRVIYERMDERMDERA